MFQFSIHRSLGLAAACLLAAGASVHAQSGSAVFLQSPSSNETRFNYYTDWASTTIAGHVSEPTGTFGGNSGLKYTFFQFNQQSGTFSGACFDIYTTHPDFLPSDVADTRIWVDTPSGLVSINDDYAGTLFSHARVWMSGANAFVNMYIAAFSTGHNQDHFATYVSAKVPLSESACTDGQTTIGWAKYKNGVLTTQAR
jgi:hypothetical protein